VTYEIGFDQITVRDATGAAVIFPWKIVRRVRESRSGFAINLMPAGTRWIRNAPLQRTPFHLFMN